MEQQKVIDEIQYYQAQKLTDMLYENHLISFDEYDKLTELNRQTFSPLFVDLFPKQCQQLKRYWHLPRIKNQIEYLGQNTLR